MLNPLIYNSDIKAIEESSSISPQEAILLRYFGALETKIQSHARNHFNHLKQEILLKFSDAKLEFIQFDNGANLTEKGKFKKWREGTVSGFPDIMILVSYKGRQLIIFVEFKRVGTPSMVKVSESQKHWNSILKTMGFSAYITNNPVFFEKVICEEIRSFFE